MWCSACGSEYRSGSARCPDCDVALGDAPPPAGARDADHDQREYDLAGWTAAQRRVATFWLERMDIPAEWRPDGVLVVPRAREIQVDDLIDSLGDRAPDDEPALDAPPAAPRLLDGDVRAGPGRRFSGFLIDYVVLTALAALIFTFIGGRGISVDAAVILTDAVYFVGATAIWGRTLGKLVVHTQVVRVDGISPPGLEVAIIRYAVVALAIALSYLGSLGGWASFFWTIAVYVPIFGAQRRGLHDRAARTDVVYRERRNPPRSPDEPDRPT